MNRSASTLLFSLLLALTLTACDTMSSAWNDVAGDDMPPANALPSPGCPQVAVIRSLSIYQNPPQADENTLVLTARMGKLRSSCESNEAGVTVNASFDVAAMKGQNSASNHVSIPFFVSVVDAGDNVISKNVYEIPLDFDDGAMEAHVTTPIQPQFNVRPGESGAKYRVLVGFHLNPSQIDANARFFGEIPSATSIKQRLP
ncbi:MAG TPA: hypothetical protein VHB73_02925 [Alphaproteobacteria bacterium]|nr:hypothetical protein [Alphaproteobacteria bacterium]